MKKPLKVAMVHTANAGVAYIRMIQYANYMRRRADTEVAYDRWDKNRIYTCEWECKVRDPKVMKMFDIFFKNADVVVVQTVSTGGGIALLATLQETFHKPILMECDDYHFGVPSYNPAFKEYTPGSDYERWGRAQMSLSDGMIVSTEWLKKQFLQYNKRVDVVRNGIDFEQWSNLKEPKPHKNIRIGWCAGAGHNEDLKLIENVFYTILDKYPNVEFYISGGDVPKFKKHNRLIAKISFTDILAYPQKLKNLGFDIGIAPLRDNGFTRGKSNLRWLEYSALSIPSVCSNIEPFKNIQRGVTGLLVNDNDNLGFLANDEKEWVDKLSILIENESWRKDIGRNAYNEVLKNYNISEISNEYYQILKGYV